MIRRLQCFALFVLFVANGLAALDHARMADAFDQYETPPGWDGRDGAARERGPFQFREITWRQHMPGRPFAEARQAAPARACALKHIAWLARSLEARGVPATPFNLAAAWNAGLDTYTTGRAPERAYHYAAAIERIYASKVTITAFRPFVIRLNP